MPVQTYFLRRNFIYSVAVFALTSITTMTVLQSAYAYDEKSTSSLNVDVQGVALKGYDTVSYFSSGGPIQGNANFAEKFNGTTYWFANSGNRDIFKANPEKYIPAFGGFCAMGLALKQKLDVDPQLWRIVDGTLYLNIHKPAQNRWLEDVKGNIEKANKNWPDIKDRAPNTL